MAPTEWTMDAAQVLESHREEWAQEKLKTLKVLMNESTETEPSKVDGVVEFLIWDFFEVFYYIYPVLHGEISLVNSAMYGLYSPITAI